MAGLRLTLAEHVAAEAAIPFAMGSADCAHFCARWVLAMTGRDALAVFGGLDRRLAESLVAERRLLRSFFEGCRSVGLPLTRSPVAGDVGVIRSGSVRRCAIRTKQGWVFREEVGITFVRFEYVKTLMAWSVYA